MIGRYTRPAMGEIWSDDGRIARWLRVEIAVCEAWAERGRQFSAKVKDLTEWLTPAPYFAPRSTFRRVAYWRV